MPGDGTGRTRILANPAAGRGRGRKLVERVRALASGLDLEVRISRGSEDLTLQARAAVSDRIERLLVAGGDGTVHWVVQGLAGTDCALGILPTGSGNDLAGVLGLPADLEEALQRALRGPLRRIDLGAVEDRLYAGYGGVGLDGEVCRTVEEEMRWIRGPLAYPCAALVSLLRFVPPRLTVEHDEGRFEDRAMFSVLSNSPRFGGGMRIAPEARIDDGLLDLVFVSGVSRLDLLRTLPKVYSGRHATHPSVRMLRTRNAKVSSDRPVMIYGDGEPIRPLERHPVRFRCVPDALAVAG
jgi:YegS/Rv2252/BmrU family lipid kinase